MDGIPKSSLTLNSDVQNLITIKSVKNAKILLQNPEVIVQPRKLLSTPCQINKVHPLITEFNDPECFHRSLIPVLTFSQLFGIFPISRVSNKNPKMLNFNVKSFITFYSTIVLMAIFYLACKSTIILIQTVNKTGGCTLDTEVARINDYSKLILPIIYECPLSKFTIETDRLQRQLTSDVIELTGMKFFSITRGFILTIAGTIVTYEIILLQFSYNKRRF
ncbi:hypothetical protein HCN44_002579 [Aphidius gifuensis]|uniref:Gustatory receptor n=1 Tax=Aphidius gifuensis TaxID=684658 RepID=A0A835CWZ5_APHGI|nr:hypothetical protein HCN44_002579 [Aphidius gifuensis]